MHSPQCIHFIPKVQPFNTPSLSLYIFLNKITHKTLTQLLNSFCYRISVSLSLISDSISVVLDNTQALPSVKISRAHLVPDQKKISRASNIKLHTNSG